MEGNVYIFDFGDKIKAGYSTNVAKRQRTIELSSGVKALNVYSVVAGRNEEQILHSYLDNRLEGEFFAFPFETAKAILSSIAAGEITTRRGGKASTRAQNKYIAKAYDRIQIVTPKGRKEVIQAHAAARGESVNGFIGRAITEAMERDSGAGNGTESPSERIPAPGSLTTAALEIATKAAQMTGETPPAFIERAAATQAKRDAASIHMGINPATGERMNRETVSTGPKTASGALSPPGGTDSTGTPESASGDE